MPWRSKGGSVEIAESLTIAEILNGYIKFSATRDGEDVTCIINEDRSQGEQPYYELVYQDTLSNFATVTFNEGEYKDTFIISNVNAGVSITGVWIEQS